VAGRCPSESARGCPSESARGCPSESARGCPSESARGCTRVITNGMPEILRARDLDLALLEEGLDDGPVAVGQARVVQADAEGQRVPHVAVADLVCVCGVRVWCACVCSVYVCVYCYPGPGEAPPCKGVCTLFKDSVGQGGNLVFLPWVWSTFWGGVLMYNVRTRCMYCIK
jgi:hypothetical protein